MNFNLCNSLLHGSWGYEDYTYSYDYLLASFSPRKFVFVVALVQIFLDEIYLAVIDKWLQAKHFISYSCTRNNEFSANVCNFNWESTSSTCGREDDGDVKSNNRNTPITLLFGFWICLGRVVVSLGFATKENWWKHKKFQCAIYKPCWSISMRYI